MNPIGEILLDHGWLARANLERALAGQRQAGSRLCSMLIARGELTPDHAARALGEQHGVAAVLQKHFEHRERALATLLVPGLARSYCALPIGRMGDRALIVCVRDPKPELRTALQNALPGERIVFAVAPARQLELLVAQVYDEDQPNEFEVDLTTGQVAIEAPEPLADLGAMTLVELDDSRVAKDPSQSGMFTASGQAPPALPGSPRATIPPLSRTTTPGSTSPPASRTTTPRTTSPPLARPPTSPLPPRVEPQVPLPDTLVALDRATTRDDATALAMAYARGRWHASLLLTLNDGAALGHRGHGAQLGGDSALSVVIPLTAASIVKAAHDARRLITVRPAGGAIQDRLERLLGQPRFVAAAPVSIAGHLTCVLVTGDPIAGDAAAASADLERLATALGQAYSRIVREPKKS